MPAGRTLEIGVPEAERLREVDVEALDAAVRAAVPECHGITVHRLHELDENGRETGVVLVEAIQIHVTGSRDGEPIKASLRKAWAEHKPKPRRTVAQALDEAKGAEKQALLERIVREKFGSQELKNG